MSVVEQYNNLSGIVSRAYLRKIITDAVKQEQPQIVKRLSTVLRMHPTVKEFDIAITNPVIECVPGTVMGCLQPDDVNEETGLAGVSQQDIYDKVTEMMINTINKVGHLPWQKEWQGTGGDAAKNYVSKKPYTGINFIMLNFEQKLDKEGKPYIAPIKFNNPYYLTFKQIEAAGAKLNKGSKASQVFYYTMIFGYRNNGLEIKTSDREKFKQFLTKNGLSNEDVKQHGFKIPVIKYYNVFRADDCTGLKFPEVTERPFVEPIDAAQAIIDHYPSPPEFTYGGDDAAYFPKADIINMPVIEDFDKPASYYSTFFHELIHSTGHSRRLDRGNDTRVRTGSIEDKRAYAFEELIAELGAVYLSSEAGILFSTRENSAKYLAGWNKRLVSAMKNDNKFFIKAAASAQKGSNYILDLDKDDVPAYLKDIKIKPAKEPKKEIPKKQVNKKTVKEPVATRREKSKKKYENSLFPGLAAPKCEAVADVELQEVPVIVPEPVSVPNSVIKNSNVLTSEQLMNMEFEYLEMDGEWADFMQEPAKNMKIAIWGKPKNGKTSGAAKLANYLTKFGNVLYNFVDQGFNKSTQDIWKNSGNSENPKAFPGNARTLDELESLIASGDYQFVFIDMINDYIDKEKTKPQEFKERFIEKYPSVSFILIMEVTKSGNFRGDQKWTHIVDAICTVEDFLMENRGRYGVGHHVIWEEQFKKLQPKKYAELQEEKNVQEEKPEEIMNDETPLKFKVI